MSQAIEQPVSGRVPLGAWLLAAVLTAEIGGWVLWDSDALRAMLVSGLLAAGLLPLARRVLRREPVWLPKLAGSQVVVLGLWGLVGLIGLALALAQNNDRYFIVADIYHWFAELLLAAIVTAMAFGMGNARDAARAVAVIGVVIGAVCMVTFVLGTLQIFEGGTHYVRNLGIARLIVGRGTPQLMLLIVTAALVRFHRWDRTTRMLLILAWVLLMMGLVVTLKRTLWLSFPIAAMFVVLPRRALLAMVFFGVFAAGVGCLLIFFMPDTVSGILKMGGEALTYNPGFTVEDTLARRSEQLASVWPYISEHPGGHGLGASVYAYWSRGQTYAELHYIHNFYAYYALQLGVGPMLLTMALTGWMGWRWMRVESRYSEWGFAVRAGLGCLVALAINGLSLVPTHTLFAGFAIGLGMIGYTKLLQERAA